MKFPVSMLQRFVSTSLNAEQIGDLLTMAGFELEGIEEVEGQPVLDIKVMSNRGDGLSVFGLAREVLAKDPDSNPTELYLRSADRFEDAKFCVGVPETSVRIETPACNRYACLILKGVSRQTSEEWMQETLRQAGMRPISLLVDVTNYVMLEQGQPLHAFDFDTLAEGRIVVREAQVGEKLQTLNGEDHELSAGQMMICDASKPVAVAGVMGGSETEVSDTTTTVLLESAHFLNTSVRKTRKQLGLNTEASYRFERSVDPDGVVAAMKRYVELVLQADPGASATEVIDVYPGKKELAPLELRVARASMLLGMEISSDQAERYLNRLGFQATKISSDVIQIVPPSWRPDIVREEDLVEELGRIHGYDLIPEQQLQGTTSMGGAQGFELWTDWLREACLRVGLTQTISHSLRDIHPLDAPLTGGRDRIGPRTPASPDTSYLRNSILSSLGDAARKNNPKEVQLFEIGRVFDKVSEGYLEQTHLGGLTAGPVQPSGWNLTPSGSSSFYTAKGIIEAILGQVGVRFNLVAPSTPDPRFHPTRQANIVSHGTTIGIMGQLHPNVAKDAGLVSETSGFELTLQPAFALRDSALRLTSVSRHPSVRRDMSVLADRTISYETISETIGKAVGDVLERQWLFDEFAGQGIPEGKRALGIAIQLRKPDSTFTDEEANQVRDSAVAALATIGATTR